MPNARPKAKAMPMNVNGNAMAHAMGMAVAMAMAEMGENVVAVDGTTSAVGVAVPVPGSGSSLPSRGTRPQYHGHCTAGTDTLSYKHLFVLDKRFTKHRSIRHLTVTTTSPYEAKLR